MLLEECARNVQSNATCGTDDACCLPERCNQGLEAGSRLLRKHSETEARGRMHAQCCDHNSARDPKHEWHLGHGNATSRWQGLNMAHGRDLAAACQQAVSMCLCVPQRLAPRVQVVRKQHTAGPPPKKLNGNVNGCNMNGI